MRAPPESSEYAELLLEGWRRNLSRLACRGDQGPLLAKCEVSQSGSMAVITPMKRTGYAGLIARFLGVSIFTGIRWCDSV